MAIQAINTLKNWFKTGLKPTQSNFWDWLDSYRHKSDAITMTDLDEALQTAINNAATATNKIVLPAGTASYNIAPVVISAILFEDESNPAGLSVGLTEGGGEVYPAYDAANGFCLQSGFYKFKTATTIYFSNITVNTIITIYKA